MFSPEQVPTYLDYKQSLFLFRFSEGSTRMHERRVMKLRVVRNA